MIYSPPVLTPNAATVWTVGERTKITWYVEHTYLLAYHRLLTSHILGMLPTPPHPSPTKDLSFSVKMN